MAIVFDSDDGDGIDYLDKSSPTIDDFPLTFACWVKPESINDWDGMINLGTSGSAYHYIAISLRSNSYAVALVRGAGGASQSVSGSSYTAGDWQHVAGVFSGSASRIVYLDGVAGAEQTTNRPASGMDRLILGEWSGTQSRPLDGSLAECAIWNVALTAGEILSLSKGVAATAIRPASLVSYYPLVRDYIDVMGANAISPNNTVVYGSHPRIMEEAPPTFRPSWGGL
tara:strand:- start:1978 stop:2658 length:681 start_codon:yes stop_codon:yes gene_type:complete